MGIRGVLEITHRHCITGCHSSIVIISYHSGLEPFVGLFRSACPNSSRFLPPLLSPFTAALLAEGTTASPTTAPPVPVDTTAQITTVAASAPTTAPVTASGVCEKWCDSNEAPWSTKCKWPSQCGGCPACSGEWTLGSRNKTVAQVPTSLPRDTYRSDNLGAS